MVEETDVEPDCYVATALILELDVVTVVERAEAAAQQRPHAPLFADPSIIAETQDRTAATRRADRTSL